MSSGERIMADIEPRFLIRDFEPACRETSPNQGAAKEPVVVFVRQRTPAESCTVYGGIDLLSGKGICAGCPTDAGGRNLMSRLALTLCALIAILISPAGFAATTQAVYVASDGTMYLLSPGDVKRGACGPIPGGYECSANGKRVISVLDGWGCQEKNGFASCTVVTRIGGYTPRGTSTLECDDRNYELSDGAGGQCTENNGEEMTCEQPNSTNFATATCEEGCGVTSGSGSCRVTSASNE